jgi:hypothetical protein
MLALVVLSLLFSSADPMEWQSWHKEITVRRLCLECKRVYFSQSSEMGASTKILQCVEVEVVVQPGIYDSLLPSQPPATTSGCAA